MYGIIGKQKGIKMITLTDINESLQDFDEWCVDSYGDEYSPSLSMINAWQAAYLRSQDKIIELQDKIKELEFKEYEQKIARTMELVRVDVLSDEEIAELEALVDEINEFEDKQMYK
jgi:hypothetical protein